MASAPSSVDIAGLKLLRRGKVRDVYDLGTKLLIVASDRLSAFDVVLPTPIPDKGKILTTAALFWFDLTKDLVANHLITADFDEIQKALPKGVVLDKNWFDGRMMLVHKAERIDAECVARAYLAGSGWKEYKTNGNVVGHSLPVLFLPNAGGIGREYLVDKMKLAVDIPELKFCVGKQQSALCQVLRRHGEHPKGQFFQRLGKLWSYHLGQAFSRDVLVVPFVGLGRGRKNRRRQLVGLFESRRKRVTHDVAV